MFFLEDLRSLTILSNPSIASVEMRESAVFIFSIIWSPVSVTATSRISFVTIGFSTVVFSIVTFSTTGTFIEAAISFLSWKNR